MVILVEMFLVPDTQCIFQLESSSIFHIELDLIFSKNHNVVYFINKWRVSQTKNNDCTEVSCVSLAPQSAHSSEATGGVNPPSPFVPLLFETVLAGK